MDEYVCVRVTDMRGIDLSVYRFDWDLTFAVLVLDAEGVVRHRYGGRDARGASRYQSSASFEAFLERVTAEQMLSSQSPPNLEDARAALAREREARLVLEEVPAFARKDRGDCIHCHSVFPALYQQGVDEGEWEPEAIWVHPPPSRIGLELDPEHPTRVIAVAEDSPAAAAGLEVDDELLFVGAQYVLSFSDVCAALHEAPDDGGTLSILVQRGPERPRFELELAPAWKRGTPASFAWRPFKWGLLPAPGFGGPQLGAGKLARLGLEEDSFAFRVQYLVTWGENSRFGQAAARAGLRQGDVVLRLGDKSDFESVDHVHAWWRLTRSVGETVSIEILRDGERRNLELVVLE